jgi:hypothetical protein
MPATQLALDGLRAGLSHLAKKPTELLTVARHAAGLRAVIPLDALRWLIERSPSKKGPKDIVLGANPPYISVGLTADLMGNEMPSAPSSTSRSRSCAPAPTSCRRPCGWPT